MLSPGALFSTKLPYMLYYRLVACSTPAQSVTTANFLIVCAGVISLLCTHLLACTMKVVSLSMLAWLLCIHPCVHKSRIRSAVSHPSNGVKGTNKKCEYTHPHPYTVFQCFKYAGDLFFVLRSPHEETSSMKITKGFPNTVLPQI